MMNFDTNDINIEIVSDNKINCDVITCKTINSDIIIVEVVVIDAPGNFSYNPKPLMWMQWQWNN